MPISPHRAAPALDRLQELRALAGTLQRPPTPSHEVVLVVHGTFANPEREPGAADGPHWWQTGGTFTNALDEALRRHGSAARCGLPSLIVDDRPALFWSGWSGANSEVERRRAAFDLAEHIRALRRRDDVEVVHIVAHSHGGNVVARALRYLNAPSEKIGQVVCLGTPFLHFEDRAIWRAWLARVHWPMLMVFALFALALARMAPDLDTSNLAAYALIGMAGGALYLLWRYAATAEGNRDDPRAVALQFGNDEAIQLLRSCAAVTARPHLYVRDLLGGPAKRLTVPPVKRPPIDDWFNRATHAVATMFRGVQAAAATVSNAWNGPVCRFMERMTSAAYRLPVAGSLCALLLILAFRPYRPPLRPFLSSRTPRLSALFFQPLRQQAEAMFPAAGSRGPVSWWADVQRGTPFDPDTIKAAVALVAAILYLMLYPLDKLLGLPWWVGAVGTRFAILIGARAAASGAPGVDMIGAAFRAVRTGEIPRGVTPLPIPPHIEDDIEARHGSTRIDTRLLRANLDPAKRSSLAAAVSAAFTDVALLHAQYYQDARIVDYVAQLIAGVENPAWMADTAEEPRPVMTA